MTSCATKPFMAGPHLSLVDQTSLPPPLEYGPEVPYRIGAFDRLSISVFGVPELGQELQVDGGGNIALPLVGSVKAADRSPEELAEAIRQQLRGQYVRDPKVAVNVTETVSKVITVDGQVAQPGLYPVLGEMTLTKAIASARGATEFARLRDVVVFRKVGDREMAALYNLQAIRLGNYPDPRVYANDTIVVGDSASRRLFRDILQASPLITTPIIALLQR